MFGGSTNKSIQIIFFLPLRGDFEPPFVSPGRCPGLDNGMPLQGGRVDHTGLVSLIRIDSGNVSPGRIFLEFVGMPLQGGLAHTLAAHLAFTTMTVPFHRRGNPLRSPEQRPGCMVMIWDG